MEAKIKKSARIVGLVNKVFEMGIACAFLNQPCEVSVLAAALREKLPIHREYPTLIVRIGYAKLLPYSTRKNLEHY